ncbi:MAG: hypothetical protein RXR31_02250 [Thermoproteota archaeon]
MIYKLVECSKCGKLSIHTGEKYFKCPHCGHRGKINGGTLVNQSEDFHYLQEYMIMKQGEAGLNVHIRKYGI